MPKKIKVFCILVEDKERRQRKRLKKEKNEAPKRAPKTRKKKFIFENDPSLLLRGAMNNGEF